MRSRRFVAAIITIGATQLMATMDGTIVVVALPKIQNALDLSDAGRSWVVTAYLLAFGGLLLVGGRLGDIFGHKRTYIVGVVLFTIASAVCGIARDGGILIGFRLLQGAAGAIIAPASLALVATTFPKGPVRNAALGVLGAMIGVSSVLSLVVGGTLAEVGWRFIFLLNVPIGLLVICIARIALRETELKRVKLDAAGAGLTTLICIAAVVTFSMGPANGWLSPMTIGPGVVALFAIVALLLVERTTENPVVPIDLFFDRNRVATFATIFLAGGVLLTLTVLVTLYFQDILGYSGLSAGVAYIPFVFAMAAGAVASSRLVTRFPPRVLVIGGGTLLLGAILYCSSFSPGIPYFPNLVVPLVIAGFGIGVADVPIGLSVLASVGLDRIGASSAMSLMLYSLGGPMVLAVTQAVVTSRTLSLGGINGPVKSMNPAQLHALDQGYTFGMMWLAGLAVLTGAVALFIGYTAQQVAHAQEVKKALDAGELDP
ncbi:MFS transporter [Mycobacterium sp. GA-1285]|nr:MFS transporter [Mycobacterium sp. GA-1285]